VGWQILLDEGLPHPRIVEDLRCFKRPVYIPHECLEQLPLQQQLLLQWAGELGSVRAVPSFRIAGPSGSRSQHTREPRFGDVKVIYEMEPTLPDRLNLKQLALHKLGRMKAFTISGLWGIDGQTTPHIVVWISLFCSNCNVQRGLRSMYALLSLCNSAYILEKSFWLLILRLCRVLKR